MNHWKRPTVSGPRGPPTEEGEAGERKGHQLLAIEGIFGEKLFWDCQECDLTERYGRDIKDECPALSDA